jgi:HlyD family secretion protein
MIRGQVNSVRPVAAILLFTGLAACGRATANERDTGAETVAVEARDLVIRVDASGEIEPLRLVEVKSNAGGEILRLHVDTGDEVDRGALLAEINPRDVRNSFAQAQADVEVARASVATREAALRRARELREANIMTVQEYESAQLDATSARAQLVKAQTNLDLATERMGDITLRAPIHGTVVQKQVEEGQIISSATSNVGGGTTLLIMADLSSMQVRTLVDQTDIGKLKVGQVARVSVDAYPNRAFTGEVTKIEPQARVEQNVTMFPVLVRLENPDRLLLPGMKADVEISVDERRGVAAVPNGAVMNPRTAMAAALGLGIDETAYRAAMRPGGGAGGQAPGPGAGSAAGAPAADCGELFQKMRSGGLEALGEADRAKMQECRSQFAGRAGGEGRRGTSGRTAGADADGRAAVVFVSGANGPEARMVLIGLNDLDYTEIVRGVEPGEHVLLVSGMQLQQQQQQMVDRMRQRAGGLPGIGGGGPPTGRIR